MICNDALNNKKKLLLEDINIQNEFSDLTYAVFVIEEILKKKNYNISNETTFKLLRLEKNV